MVWNCGDECADVRRPQLDASGLVAIGLGVLWRDAGCNPSRTLQLLDQHFSCGRFNRGAWRSPFAWRSPAIQAETALSLCRSHGNRHRSDVHHTTIRKHVAFYSCGSFVVSLVLRHREPPGCVDSFSGAPFSRLRLWFLPASWMGYYNYRVFGSPLTLPYTVNRATYAMAPYFAWQSPRPEPAYRHDEMVRFYHVDELEDYERGHSLRGFIKMTTIKAVIGTLFFTGFALLPPVFMVRRTLLDRRIRFLVVCLLVLTGRMLILQYSHSSLYGAVYSGNLWCRLAGHAPPLAMETRRPASWNDVDPADGHGSCCNECLTSL